MCVDCWTFLSAGLNLKFGWRLITARTEIKEPHLLLLLLLLFLLRLFHVFITRQAVGLGELTLIGHTIDFVYVFSSSAAYRSGQVWRIRMQKK